MYKENIQLAVFLNNISGHYIRLENYPL